MRIPILLLAALALAFAGCASPDEESTHTEPGGGVAQDTPAITPGNPCIDPGLVRQDENDAQGSTEPDVGQRTPGAGNDSNQCPA